MEKRSTPRVPLSIEVTYEFGDEFIFSYLFDISGGGVFIQTEKPLDPGIEAQFCFHVPGLSDAFLVKGTVAWTQHDEENGNPGMGVRFDEMKPEDRERLDNFLSTFDGK